MSEDSVHPLGLEPPLPPADGAERAEQDGTDRYPRVAGIQEQQDVGSEPDGGVGGPAVVAEQLPAVHRGQGEA